ncbi:hypothetical protein I350_00028 [Cryptococcus amylolentus CBS 6273]|uniref:Uncharacterized protein n=1 Tax=Cryptococcus amylolentus CBS 6273 TaxID=1296118 RepID=A0A1E3KED4_9TREE|nr:hypothetical protein I350_00028 [Cryptococcus amylolentus CBS 6273]
MKQSPPSRKSRGQAMGGGVIGFTKMFGLHAHIIEDTSPTPNPSCFAFGATDLREDDLEASWPVTLANLAGLGRWKGGRCRGRESWVMAV